MERCVLEASRSFTHFRFRKLADKNLSNNLHRHRFFSSFFSFPSPHMLTGSLPPFSSSPLCAWPSNADPALPSGGKQRRPRLTISISELIEPSPDRAGLALPAIAEAQTCWRSLTNQLITHSRRVRGGCSCCLQLQCFEGLDLRASACVGVSGNGTFSSWRKKKMCADLRASCCRAS